MPPKTTAGMVSVDHKAADKLTEVFNIRRVRLTNCVSHKLLHMATPKGTRAKRFAINATDAVHVYSDAASIWLQLRRDFPTEDNIGTTSFKAALNLTPSQAIAIAGELLTVATTSSSIKDTLEPPAPKVVLLPAPENHGKPWTPEEDKQLLSRYHSKLSIEEIAKKHKRGIGGIQSRLAKHGKIIPGSSAQADITSQTFGK